MKAASIVFGLLLLFFAVVQYNDPDPEVWMLIYGIGATLCFVQVASFRPVISYLSLAFALGCLIFAIINWPSLWMGFEQTEPPNINVEQARESCGLLIVCLFMFINSIKK